MVQQISIDPELWARTRRRAFDTRTTASRIVETALQEFLDREDRGDKLPAGLATKKPVPLKVHDEPIGRVEKITETENGVEIQATVFGSRPKPPNGLRRVEIGGNVVASHTEGDIRVIDEVKLHEVSVTSEAMPWDLPHENEVIETSMVVPGGQLYRDEDGIRRVRSPEDAAAAVAEVAKREFTPVPKPVRKPRPKR